MLLEKVILLSMYSLVSSSSITAATFLLSAIVSRLDGGFSFISLNCSSVPY